MPSTVTFDEVWKLSQETSAQLRETERIMREMRESFTELRGSFAELQEGHRKIQENSAKNSARTDLQLLETSQVVKDVSRQVGNLSGKWGIFVENMVAPGCQTLFAQRGIPVHQVHQRVKVKRDDGRGMEIDILVVNTDAVVLVEVKSTLSVMDVREHMERLKQFKEFFPRYGDCRVMGAVAGVVMEKDSESFAKKQGLFVIVQSGEGVILANEEEFKPQTW